MNRRNWKVVALSAALTAVPVILLGAVPYTFAAGQPIRASEINANFTATENEIAATSAAARPDYLRVTVVAGNGVGGTPIITIPSSATRPYLLRQILGWNGLNCVINIGSETINFTSGTITDLSIPFSANSSLTLGCNLGYAFTFVFEK